MTLNCSEIDAVIEDTFKELHLDGKRVLIIIPDGTRSMPMPMMFDLFEKHLSGKVQALDYLVALGTHQPMTDEQLSAHIGRQVTDGKAGRSRISNHLWQNADTFERIGIISAEEISLLTDGRMREDVPVRLNKLIHQYESVDYLRTGFSARSGWVSLAAISTSFPELQAMRSSTFTHWLGAADNQQ